MDPALFLDDLEAKPASLARLADAFRTGDPLADVPASPQRVLLVGMGSSRYAAGVAALRLRAAGIDAVAEYASSTIGWPPSPDLLMVAISAKGESEETIAAVDRYRGRSPVIALTDSPRSTIATLADTVVPLEAGEERGGVACRSFQHTGLLLRALEARLGGRPVDMAALCDRVATASAELLDRRAEWLPEVAATLDGPDGLYVLAPAERIACAEQGALVIREGPRRPAVGCETGDWSHVDVYLTKTLEYRALLFAGSRWDGNAIEWLSKRGSTFVAVGADVPGARACIRYQGEDDAQSRPSPRSSFQSSWPRRGGPGGKGAGTLRRRRVELEALDDRHRIGDLPFELGGLRRSAAEDRDGHRPPAGEVEQDQSDRTVETEADSGAPLGFQAEQAEPRDDRPIRALARSRPRRREVEIEHLALVAADGHRRRWRGHDTRPSTDRRNEVIDPAPDTRRFAGLAAGRAFRVVRHQPGLREEMDERIHRGLTCRVIRETMQQERPDSVFLHFPTLRDRIRQLS
jgi:fructoselysine-6-P-deglycase FrlB-like protein